MLPALLVWPLAAFGGRSHTTALIFGIACGLYALVETPRPRGRLDYTLLVLLGAIAVQMIPLPHAVLGVVSPHTLNVRQALAIGALPAMLPVSLDAGSTAWAWIVVAGSLALFWTARARFRRGGVRRVLRFISTLGLGVSLLAIAQAGTAGRDIYWLFKTDVEGPLPFGPFINRNHFATWVIMALPLCLGYIAARTGARKEPSRHVSLRSRVVQEIDPRSAWLLTSGVTMAVALLLSLSRSGWVGLAVSGALTLLLCRQRLDERRRRRVLAAAGVVVLLGLAWADIPALRERLAGSQTGLSNRVVIWQETVPAVRDFWLTGSGAGTYERAMFVYQRSSRGVYFNQAHNHYLQVLAEGGVLLVTLVVAALIALVRAGKRRIDADASGFVWIRIGAACGLGAVAIQSVWETGLVMPANAALAAVLAAILLHERDQV